MDKSKKIFNFKPLKIAKKLDIFNIVRLSFQQTEVLRLLKDKPCLPKELCLHYTNCNGYASLKNLKDSGYIEKKGKYYIITDKGKSEYDKKRILK